MHGHGQGRGIINFHWAGNRSGVGILCDKLGLSIQEIDLLSSIANYSEIVGRCVDVVARRFVVGPQSPARLSPLRHTRSWEFPLALLQHS